MIYGRKNGNFCFIFPSLAFGVDVDGKYFIEAAWLFYAIGLGEL